MNNYLAATQALLFVAGDDGLTLEEISYVVGIDKTAVRQLLEELSVQRGMHYGKEASDLSALQEIIPLQEGQVTTQDLWNALKKIARRNLDKMPLQANIQHETHTVEEMMDSILTKIQENPQKSIRFDKCFPSFHRHAIVTTFLAMLQLVREHKIRLVQHVPYEDIVLETFDKGGAFSE